MIRRDVLAGLGAAALAGLAQTGRAQDAGLAVRSDFPGGSARVLEVDAVNQTLRIAPAGHAERGWPVWWYMRISGATPGRILTVEVNVTGFGRPDRAAISLDNRTWSQTDPGEQKSRTQVIYRIDPPAGSFWLAWGPPLGSQAASDGLRAIARADRHATLFSLGRSPEGRDVPGLRVGATAGARHAIWMQARQHAWESGSSWVGFGFVDWLLSKAPAAAALRRHTEVYFVPVMDVDAVETGEGGKNQQPHDPDFDWGEPNDFPQVRTAMQRLRQLEGQKRLSLFLDLHNPEPAAKGVYFYVPAQPLLTPERLKYQGRFLDLAKTLLNGPMPFDGHLGPIGAGYDPKVDKTSESWVASFARPQVVAITVETPWNTPYSTQEGYGRVGAQLGETVAAYQAAVFPV